MMQETAEVKANVNLQAGYYAMTLRCSAAFGDANPGQFVMLSVDPGSAPLLRRPFSIHRIVRGAAGSVLLDVLYKVVGEGTALMAGVPEGASLDILGPLGRGFVLREDDRRIYLAAGGIGAAPMVFLLETLRSKSDKYQCVVFLGGRSRDDLLCRDTFERLSHETYCTTDDGSEGAQCFLTSPLEEEARRQPPDVIMACGPMDMLACVAGIADQLNIPCQLSIESTMACGMGACLGCAVSKAENEEGYFHVCKDGPVFSAHQLRF